MDKDLQDLTDKVRNIDRDRTFCEEEIARQEKALAEYRQKEEDCMKAQAILSRAAKAVQKDFKALFEKIGTQAIRGVFESRDFDFILDYDMKGRKTTATPLIMEKGAEEPQVPKNDMGHSIRDLLSIIFRPVVWRLEQPGAELLWLDEPLRNMGAGKEMEAAAAFLNDICHRLGKRGFQLIVNTHEEAIASRADKALRVTHDGKKAVVVDAVSYIMEPKGKAQLSKPSDDLFD